MIESIFFGVVLYTNTESGDWRRRSLRGLVFPSTFRRLRGSAAVHFHQSMCVCVHKLTHTHKHTLGWTDGHASYRVTAGGAEEQPDQLVAARLPPPPPLNSPFSSSSTLFVLLLGTAAAPPPTSTPPSSSMKTSGGPCLIRQD